MDVRTSLAPLSQGKEIRALKIDSPIAGQDSCEFILDSESVLVSLWCGSLSGTLDVKVYTKGTDNQEALIIDFPQLAAPTTELLLKKSAVAMQKCRVIATYSAAADFEIRLRGINAAIASTRIEGSNVFQASQINMTTTPAVLLSASLDDRNGILIINNNVGGSEILYVGGTLAEATVANGTPVYPGGNITVNLGAGALLYARSSAGTVDVRIAQVGG